MNIGEKMAYLKGLAEGIELPSDTKDGKILKGILDVMGDICISLKDLDKLKEEQADLSIYAEELDEDLGALEKAFIKNCRRSSKNSKNDGIFDFDFEDLKGLESLEDDGDIYEDFADLEGSAKINCPECGELLLFDADDIEEEGFIDCPECGAEISVIGGISSEGCGCESCRGHSCTHGDDESVLF